MQMLNIEINPKNKCVELLFYCEFNPKDYGATDEVYELNWDWFKRSINNSCNHMLGKNFDWLNFRIGRVETNAELHFIKCSILAENPYYEV